MEGRAPSWPRLALVIGRPSTEAQRTRRSASLHQHRSLAAEGRFRLLNRNRFAGGRGEFCALAQRAAVGKQRRDESGNRIAVPGKRKTFWDSQLRLYRVCFWRAGIAVVYTDRLAYT